MRKHVTILILLFAIHYYAFTQAGFWASPQKGGIAKIDSLKKALPVLHDTARVDCLNDISELYLAYNQDSSGVYATQALKEAEKIACIQGQAKAYRNLGRTESMRITDLPAGEKYFDTSLALYMTTHNDKEIAWAWAALGVSKWVIGKFPGAMEAFEKAEKLFKIIGDTTNLAATYDGMFSTAMEWGHYARALETVFKRKDITGKENYDQLSAIYRAVGDDKTAEEYSSRIAINIYRYNGLYACLDIGETFIRKKQYDSALYYYQIFADYAKENGPGPTTKLYEGLAQLYLAQKQYDTAIQYLNGALNMSKKANDRNQVMKSLLIISKTYKGKGNYENATGYARELLQIADETGARQYSRDAHFLLYEIFDHLQKQGDAYSHLRQYLVLKDSIDLDLSAQKLAFYKTKSEREQAESKINLLNEDKKLQQQQLKQTEQQKKFLVAGLILLLLIGLILFGNISLKRKAEKTQLQLAENQLKITKLEYEKRQSGFLQQAAELEMQVLRSQMNPHFIFNCLNAINGFIITNEAETAADYLTKFARLIRMVLNNSLKKSISLEKELETLGLYLYMESLRYKNNFQYKINCDDNIDTAAIFIPPLLLQPIVENAVWHGLMNKGNNGELIVNLHLENDILHCIITDNGVGRKKAALIKSKSAEKNKSMGLEVTKNRLALLSQSLNSPLFFKITDMEDENGNAIGTSVSFTIKVTQTVAENSLHEAL